VSVMPLEKAIKHGKEHRKDYYRSQAFDHQCRPHGGCPFCYNSRMYQQRKALESAKSRSSE